MKRARELEALRARIIELRDEMRVIVDSTPADRRHRWSDIFDAWRHLDDAAERLGPR